MNQLNAFGMQDIAIIGFSICIGIIFALFFADKLFKFYLGIIVGFLLFIAANSQIDILENLYGRELTGFQNFLVSNKETILSLLSFCIPLLGILFALNPFKKGSFFATFLLGSLLPLFLLGSLGYVINSSVVQLPLLENILGFLSNSFLLDFLRYNSQYIFLGLIFLLFYKYIFALVWAFSVWLLSTLWTAFFGERESEQEDGYEDDEEEYEDEGDDEEHEEHH